jgi:hypothetical protein
MNAYDASWTVLLSYGTITKAYGKQRAVFKQTCLCIANTGGHFEHKATKPFQVQW